MFQVWRHTRDGWAIVAYVGDVLALLACLPAMPESMLVELHQELPRAMARRRWSSRSYGDWAWHWLS